MKGRLNELMSQIRMQNHLSSSSRSEINYQMDSSLQQEIKQVSDSFVFSKVISGEHVKHADTHFVITYLYGFFISDPGKLSNADCLLYS